MPFSRARGAEDGGFFAGMKWTAADFFSARSQFVLPALLKDPVCASLSSAAFTPRPGPDTTAHAPMNAHEANVWAERLAREEKALRKASPASELGDLQRQLHKIERDIRASSPRRRTATRSRT